MTRIVSLLLATTLAALAGVAPAVAADGMCWEEDRRDPFGNVDTVTVCNFGGVITEEGTPGWKPPDEPMVYDIGYDHIGECYYLRTGPWGGWVVLASSGDAILFGYDPDGIPGGPIAGDVWVDPCKSQPIPGEPPITRVWKIVETYPFQDPDPQIVPDGIGLAGAATQIFVDPPDPLFESIRSPVTRSVLEVEIRAVAVEITWGD